MLCFKHFVVFCRFSDNMVIQLSSQHLIGNQVVPGWEIMFNSIFALQHNHL